MAGAAKLSTPCHTSRFLFSLIHADLPFASRAPSEVDRELRGERPRRELRKGQSFTVILLGNPLALLNEIAMHVTDQRDRAAETESAQAQRVQDELPHRILRRRSGSAARQALSFIHAARLRSFRGAC